MSIPARVLQALVPFASCNPERKPLSGIHIERGGGLYGDTTCVATDGRRILAIRLLTPGTSNEPLAITIPTSFAWHAENASASVHLEFDFRDGGRWVRSSNFRDSAHALSGFPNWRGAIPTGEPTGQSCWTLNLGFLHSFSVALATLDPEHPGACVRHYGDNSFLIRASSQEAAFDVLGVLKGVIPSNPNALPDWAQSELKEAAAQS